MRELGITYTAAERRAIAARREVALSKNSDGEVPVTRTTDVDATLERELAVRRERERRTVERQESPAGEITLPELRDYHADKSYVDDFRRMAMNSNVTNKQLGRFVRSKLLTSYELRV